MIRFGHASKLIESVRLGVVLCAGISNAFAETQKQQAEEAVIRALDEKWSAIALKNDVDGAVAFYAEDVVLLAPNVPIAAGKKSIRESWAGLLGPNTAVTWKVTEVEVAKPGDLGYLYGTYQLSMPDPKGRKRALNMHLDLRRV